MSIAAADGKFCAEQSRMIAASGRNQSARDAVADGALVADRAHERHVALATLVLVPLDDEQAVRVVHIVDAARRQEHL